MKTKKANKRKCLIHKRYLVIGFILTTFNLFTANAQTFSVTGSVYDTKGEPLIGASVSIKSTTQGVITDINGNFSIKAKNGDILIFKYLGFQDKEIKVTKELVGRVIMEETSVNLNELVVVGYGTQRKRDVAGSISSINEKVIEQKVPVNVFDALQGAAAGVQITSLSGAPGEGSSIIIRGASTFEGGTTPLYVVDGIIMESIDMINPSDIVSADILKDAASTSIYGARAANGVVLITTKSGEVGKPRVNVRYLNSYGFLSNKIPQLNREEREIFDNTVVSAGSKNQFQFFKNSIDSVNMQARTSNDYQDIISQTAVRHDANISMQAGNDKMNVYTSLGLLDETGIILTSYFKRYTGRSKISYKASEHLKFTTNISGSYQNKSNINESMTFYQALRRPPQSILWFPDGSLVKSYEAAPNGKRNPLIELYYRNAYTKRYSANLYQNAEFSFAKYFTLTGAATANLDYQERTQYVGPETQTSRPNVESGVDSGYDRTSFFTDILLEGFLRYQRSFNNKHNVEITAGASMQENNIKERVTTMNNFLIKNENMHVPQGTLETSTSTLNATGTAIASQFARISYDYMSRYIFRANIRRDGSSLFGKNNRWGVFPAISGAWRISDESFMKWSKPILTDAKLRASWGIAGNDKIGVFDTRTVLSVSASPYSYGGVPGVYPDNRVGNAYLKWEETKQMNIGLDLTLFDGRLSLVADYYIKKTNDLFNLEQLPSEIGYKERRMNIGSIKNKGLEISITAVPVSTKDFTWTSTINWSMNKNKILSISSDPYAYETNWWVAAGEAAGNFYGYKQMGIYEYDASNAYTKDYKTRLIPVFERDSYGNVMITKSGGPQLIGYKYPDGRDYGWIANGTGNEIYQLMSGDGTTPFKGGDTIWDDYNKDGTIDSADKQILGNAQPDWYGGWNNTFNYKGFTLNLNFYVSWGGLIYNQLLYSLSRYPDNTSNADPRGTVQGWRYQGQITDWYAPGQASQNGRNYAENGRSLSSFYLEDASFIRLQSLRLAYQFPSNFTRKTLLQNMQIYVYGNNLLTWTNYRGYDPEISTGGVLNPGADSQKYPKKRELGFGINFTL